MVFFFFCLVLMCQSHILSSTEFSFHYFCGLVFIYVRVPALTVKECVLFCI